MNKVKNLNKVLVTSIALNLASIHVAFCDSTVDAKSPVIEIVEAPLPDAVDAAQKTASKPSKVAPVLPKSELAKSDTDKQEAIIQEEIKLEKTKAIAAPSFARGNPSMTLQTAKGEKLAIASGHYARARALLISALREFDKGYNLVDPSALVDVDGWRQGVTLRAQELARVLDPQPRSSRTGMRYDESTAGIGNSGARKK